MTPAASLALTQAGSGPALLMLHGIGGSRTAWDRQIERLQRDFTCLAPDLPGYGDSPDPSEDGLATIVRSLEVLLGGRSAYVLGVSFGGLCALALARALPGRIRSLVLADATLGRGGESAERCEKWMTLREQLAADLQERSRERAAQIATPGASAEIVDEIAAHMRRARPVGYLNVARAIVHADARPWLPYIGCPSLILCGENDGVTGVAVSQALASGLPDARLMMIPNAGHAPHIEQPDLFAASVRDFLTNAGE